MIPTKPTAEVTPIVKESDVEVQVPIPEDEIKKEDVLDGQDKEEVNPEEKIRNNIMKCGSCMII